MDYATFTDMVERIGATQLIVKFKKLSAVQRQAQVEDYILTGESEIDAAAKEAGYKTPIVASDLTTDTDTQDKITAWLKSKALALALHHFYQPLDTTEQQEKVKAWCREQLKGLRAGTALPVDPPVSAIAGALEWVSPEGASSALTPWTFQRIRGGAP